MKNLNYLMDQDDIQDVKYIIKTHETVADNLQIKNIYKSNRK